MNKKILNISIVAAIYIVLCLVLSPISFGPIQFRLSEILCLLSIEFPWAIYGVSIGCFVSNLLFGGLGLIDAIFGSLATFVACVFAYLFNNRRINNYPVLSALLIVIINAFVIGAELGFIYGNMAIIPISILEVGISETLIMTIGLFLYPKLIEIVKDKVK